MLEGPVYIHTSFQTVVFSLQDVEFSTQDCKFSLQAELYSLYAVEFSPQDGLFSLQSGVFSVQAVVVSLQVGVFSPHVVVFSLQAGLFNLQTCKFSLQAEVFSPHAVVFSLQDGVFGLQPIVFSVQAVVFSLQAVVFSVRLQLSVYRLQLHCCVSNVMSVVTDCSFSVLCAFRIMQYFQCGTLQQHVRPKGVPTHTFSTYSVNLASMPSPASSPYRWDSRALQSILLADPTLPWLIKMGGRGGST